MMITMMMTLAIILMMTAKMIMIVVLHFISFISACGEGDKGVEWKDGSFSTLDRPLG
jgi:hypothetical protein